MFYSIQYIFCVCVQKLYRKINLYFSCQVFKYIILKNNEAVT
jgi:hypothetical protein